MNETSLFSDEKIMFSGLSNESIMSRADIEGEKIWNFLFSRDPQFGAIFFSAYGMMGSGKSSMLHHIARRLIKENDRGELLFWRENTGSPIQVKNGGYPFQLFCEKRHPMELKILTEHGLEPCEDIPIRLFSGWKDLISKSEPNVMSCVYLHDTTRWLSLINRLKILGRWSSIFLDEAEDVIPLRVSGSAWRLNEEFAASIKEIRKSFVSIYMDSQQLFDLDYRITSKVMVTAYLMGSRRDEHSPLFRGAVQSLEQGSGWLDLAHARFGLIKFGAVPPVPPVYYVVPRRKKNVL